MSGSVEEWIVFVPVAALFECVANPSINRRKDECTDIDQHLVPVYVSEMVKKAEFFIFSSSSTGLCSILRDHCFLSNGFPAKMDDTLRLRWRPWLVTGQPLTGKNDLLRRRASKLR